MESVATVESSTTQSSLDNSTAAWSLLLSGLEHQPEKCVKSTAYNHESPNPADGKEGASVLMGTGIDLSLWMRYSPVLTTYIHYHPCTHFDMHTFCAVYTCMHAVYQYVNSTCMHMHSCELCSGCMCMYMDISTCM